MNSVVPQFLRLSDPLMDRNTAISENSTLDIPNVWDTSNQWDIANSIPKHKTASLHLKIDIPTPIQPQPMTTCSTHRPFEFREETHHEDDCKIDDVQSVHSPNHLQSLPPPSQVQVEGPPVLSPFPIQPGPSFYHQLLPYSSTEFDMLKILSKVASRPNPKITLGPVDMTCSFAVADARDPDNPLIYASPTFCRLTGYSESEILGRNCRFLQSPTGMVHRGEPRVHTAPDAVRYFYLSLLQEKECQASLINYRKDGSAFVNLVTLIPISEDDSGEITHFIGFQVDLTKYPGAVLQKLRDGSCIVNYSAVNMGPGGIRDRRGRGVSNELIHMIRGANQEPVGRETERTEIHNLVLDNIEDFVHVLSLKGSLLYAAPSISRVLGYDAQELIGRSIADLCHPADVVPVMRELKDASSTPIYQVSHPSARLAYSPGFLHMSPPTPPPPSPTSLLFRALHKDGHYVWIISRGRLHVEPGKGRKAVILVGRRIDSGILDAVMSRLLETRISQPEPFGDNGWGLIATNGIILFANAICSQRLGFSTMLTIAPSYALLSANASAHCHTTTHQHFMSRRPDSQMGSLPNHQHQSHNQHLSHSHPFQGPLRPSDFFSHVPATLVGRSLSSLIIPPDDQDVLRTLIDASSTHDNSARKTRCRIRGYRFNNDHHTPSEETIPVEIRFYSTAPNPDQPENLQMRTTSSILFEMVFLPDNEEAAGTTYQNLSSFTDYKNSVLSQGERTGALPADACRHYQSHSGSLTSASTFSKPQNSQPELGSLYPLQKETTTLPRTGQSTPHCYSDSPRNIHFAASSHESTLNTRRSPAQAINANDHDTPFYTSSTPQPQVLSTPKGDYQTSSQSPSRPNINTGARRTPIMLSSLSTSPTNETSWQYELTRLRFENERMRAELAKLEKLRERSRRTRFHSFQPTTTLSRLTSYSLKRPRGQESGSME